MSDRGHCAGRYTAGTSALHPHSRWTEAPHRTLCRRHCLRKIQESSLGVPTKSCLIEANAPFASTLIRPVDLCGVRGLHCMHGREGAVRPALLQTRNHGGYVLLTGAVAAGGLREAAAAQRVGSARTRSRKEWKRRSSSRARRRRRSACRRCSAFHAKCSA